jgi:hypothetical protein
LAWLERHYFLGGPVRLDIVKQESLKDLQQGRFPSRLGLIADPEVHLVTVKRFESWQVCLRGLWGLKVQEAVVDRMDEQMQGQKQEVVAVGLGMVEQDQISIFG